MPSSLLPESHFSTDFSLFMVLTHSFLAYVPSLNTASISSGLTPSPLGNTYCRIQTFHPSVHASGLTLDLLQIRIGSSLSWIHLSRRWLNSEDCNMTLTFPYLRHHTSTALQPHLICANHGCPTVPALQDRCTPMSPLSTIVCTVCSHLTCTLGEIQVHSFPTLKEIHCSTQTGRGPPEPQNSPSPDAWGTSLSVCNMGCICTII